MVRLDGHGQGRANYGLDGHGHIYHNLETDSTVINRSRPVVSRPACSSNGCQPVPPSTPTIMRIDPLHSVRTNLITPPSWLSMHSSACTSLIALRAFKFYDSSLRLYGVQRRPGRMVKEGQTVKGGQVGWPTDPAPKIRRIAVRTCAQQRHPFSERQRGLPLVCTNTEKRCNKASLQCAPPRPPFRVRHQILL